MIMGRKTFDSLGKPLPGRRHIVVSRNPEYQPVGGDRAGSLDEAVAMCGDVEKVFIIGGAEIFSYSLDFADTILLTEIDIEVPGDVFFPELPPGAFLMTSRQDYPDASTPFTVVTYRKRASGNA